MMSKKVLVVEDNHDFLAFLGQILASLGWHTTLADSGWKALNQLAYELPSVILLDIRMPEMDGYELAKILKAHPVYRDIPILAASAISDHLAREQCLAAGCDDFISKPFAIRQLQTYLARLVTREDQKRSRQKHYERGEDAVVARPADVG